MTLIIDENSGNKKRNLLLLGISIGLCIMSKVHGIFLWFGFGLYILFYQRKMLRSGYLYIAVLISIIIFSPIFSGNSKIISSLIFFTATGLDFLENIGRRQFLQQLFGSIFYNNPVNIILYIIPWLRIAKKKLLMPPGIFALYLLLALPLIIVLLVIHFLMNVTNIWSGLLM